MARRLEDIMDDVMDDLDHWQSEKKRLISVLDRFPGVHANPLAHVVRRSGHDRPDAFLVIFTISRDDIGWRSLALIAASLTHDPDNLQLTVFSARDYNQYESGGVSFWLSAKGHDPSVFADYLENLREHAEWNDEATCWYLPDID